MPKWIIGTAKWLWLHREGIFGGTVVAFIALLLGAMKWWYEFKELRRKDKERKLDSAKEIVLNTLRRNMAYAGLNGQKVDQIVSQCGLKENIVEKALSSLANESPVRAHLWNSRWYLGPFPPGIFTPPPY